MYAKAYVMLPVFRGIPRGVEHNDPIGPGQRDARAVMLHRDIQSETERDTRERHRQIETYTCYIETYSETQTDRDIHVLYRDIRRETDR